MAVFVVFLIGYMLSQFFRAFLTVIAPELSAELGLSKADLGAISAAWFVSFAAAQFAVGPALDRVGPRRTVAATMLVAVVGAIVFAAAGTAWTAMLGMALIGVGCSAVYMGALFVFARTRRPEQFATLASVLIGLGSLGNLLGATPLALAAQTIGWRAAMLGIAAATAASAALLAVYVRDPAKPEAGHGTVLGSLARLISMRALWPIFPIALLSYSVVITERGLWIGPFLSDVHALDAIGRGNGVLAMAVAMSAGAFAYAPADRLLGTRKWVAFGGTLVTAALFVALARSGDASAGTAIGLLSGIGFFGLTYGVVMAHARTFLPPALVGQGLTLMNALFIGGAAILQPLSGALMDHWTAEGGRAYAYASLHALFGALLVAAALVYAAAPERDPA